MLNKFVAIGLGAVIALAPLAAAAQTEQLAQAAPAATDTTAAKPMAKPAMHKGKAPAHHMHMKKPAHHMHMKKPAHHMHKKKMAPAAPAAPKS
jgi:hypothetical protein